MDDSVDRADAKRLQAVEELANIELSAFIWRLFREKNVSESELPVAVRVKPSKRLPQ
ncbi:hypothetical protein ACT691_06895 [Vibrio metschnikovii]